LDARLPFDEPYRIPASTAKSIRMAWAVGGRVIAVGTTVVRALEHSAFVHGSVRASTGIAVNKIGLGTSLRVVDAVLSGTHEPGTSHYNLLAAFVDEQILCKMDDVLQHDGYRTHEFGDSVFIEKTRVKCHLSGGNRSDFQLWMMDACGTDSNRRVAEIRDTLHSNRLVERLGYSCGRGL
jgi:S-adenosylmethionine:tRNA ribosyltransferase-isomerase